MAPETLKPQLDEVDAQLLTAVDQRSQRSAELAQAQAELGRIHGGADAATAESRRLEALGDLARRTQEIFLTHHAHLIEVARESMAPDVHVIELDRI